MLNVLWLLLAGVWLFLAYLFAGITQIVTIIGIPFGVQSFKLAGFALWPFGRVVVTRSDRSQSLSCVGNVVWFVLSGFWLALLHALLGVLLCLTIIGIPLGVGNFKLIPLALAPFGRDIVRKGDAVPGGQVVAF
ncbi:MAG: YccF domain-containing protein [Acidimicrobiales bacterium]